MYVEGGNISYSHSDIPTLLGKREVGQCRVAVLKDGKLTMLSGTYNFTIYKKVKPRDGDCEGKEDKESRRSKQVCAVSKKY